MPRCAGKRRLSRLALCRYQNAQVPGLLQPTAAPAANPYAPPPPAQQQPYAPQPTGATDFFGPAAPAPQQPTQDDSWGLDGLDLSGGPSATPAPASHGGANGWPAPEGVDEAVWRQLPEATQRELLMQRGTDPDAGVPSPQGQNAPPRGPTGADAYRQWRAAR